MRKNLQQHYLATLKKCATPPMVTATPPVTTTQPQRQQQTKAQLSATTQLQQKEQQKIKLRSICASPKRYMLTSSGIGGLCLDCFHVALGSSLPPAYNRSRSNGTSALQATTATAIQTPNDIKAVVQATTAPVVTATAAVTAETKAATAATVDSAMNLLVASAGGGVGKIETTASAAKQQTRVAEVKIWKVLKK
ncbi:PREDICTED: uncharacterized protein LOC108373525 [Rhagoletis zephyria]|uniref:uncharacterized protein LOC108373525 n=1 Tax=Rhagoletis zephyria TaxID=28612 RepID=UPI000811604D|nr:PREDICTED: uncharacterized protein LOC108373525 [Rhagoletis zephyria]